MATSSWTENSSPTMSPGSVLGQYLSPNWVEKYRAALIELNPAKQLDRIAEAYAAIQGHMQGLLADHYERQAIEDARLILSLLREESLGRVNSAPWL
jgi:hypothetical protein